MKGDDGIFQWGSNPALQKQKTKFEVNMQSSLIDKCGMLWMREYGNSKRSTINKTKKLRYKL